MVTRESRDLGIAEHAGASHFFHTQTHTHTNVVKLWHVISSPLVTRVCTIIVTHLEPRGIAQDDQITAGRARADEETPGSLKDERQFWQIHREVHGAFRRHNIPSGGHVGRLVLLGNNGWEQLIASLDVLQLLLDAFASEQIKQDRDGYFH